MGNDKFELTDESYSVTDIKIFFEYIIKKSPETMAFYQSYNKNVYQENSEQIDV